MILFSEFESKVSTLLDGSLPKGKDVIADGRSMARDITIGRTSFMDEMDVTSEVQYKRRCIKEGQIMFHAHIGMSTWHDTADALAQIHREADKSGIRIDRAGICLDRRMALPDGYRDKVPAETGPMLSTPEDWYQVGQAAPIQPHMGDFMIGFPASVENTIRALCAGVTTIGNLSQFIAHEAPSWRDTRFTTTETVRALALMGALTHKGTLIHSYLEDGFGAIFRDCTTLAGWALLERYLVEELIHGKLSHCIGGLTTDPVKRAGWVFALNEIHEKDCIGSMFYGDTLSCTQDYSANAGVVSEYLLWDIMAQLECPTGHAVLPIPVTEAVRVPSSREILEAHRLGRQIESAARNLHPHMDFSASRSFARQVVRDGTTVFKNALDGLAQAGVNIKDPVQLLFVLKKLGPVVFESMFGLDYENPRIPTDSFELSDQCYRENRGIFLTPAFQKKARGKKILIASSDVHEHAIGIMTRLFSEAGAQVINLGAEINPDELAATAAKEKTSLILVSTHNGMALEYAHNLKTELKERHVFAPVIMGGVLNQKIEDQILPVDVTDRLREIGILPCKKLNSDLTQLINFKPKL